MDMLNQIAGFDANALRHPRKKTYGVKVGNVTVGGSAPIVVQSMTNTDTADVETTLRQTLELAEAGSEIVRWTVNVPEAAAAVPVIKKRLLDAGCNVPIIGDFHYNGHVLLTKYPECAAALDKYRINPGNVGAGQRRDEQFSTICKVAVDHGKPRLLTIAWCFRLCNLQSWRWRAGCATTRLLFRAKLRGRGI